MTFSLGDIVLVSLFGALLVHLWRAQGVREAALTATQRHLKGLHLSLLDEHVALRAVWLKRNPQGQLQFWRRYHFEFTVTGHERYRGYIVMLGYRVELIELQPHRLPGDIDAPDH